MKNITGLVLMLLLFVACSQNPASLKETSLNHKADSVLKLMTLQEKIGQMVLYTSDWDVTGPTIRSSYLDDVKKGNCGNIFNAHTVSYVRTLQEAAVKESRLGIPLLFGYDVIHGYK